MRTDNRTPEDLRPVHFELDPIKHAEGSVIIAFGDTKVLCSASVEEKVPKWMQGSKKGWVTAEYGMLPRSTHSRINREKGFNSGRSQEISRLIGRSLRACVDLSLLGERQIYVDCDVIQADGGTRTAAITGGFVALSMACQYLTSQGLIKQSPIKNHIAAISVGIQRENILLDLNYDEDSTIGTDMNFVMNDENKFIEIQGTAELEAFSKDELLKMLTLAQAGCSKLIELQHEALKKNQA